MHERKVCDGCGSDRLLAAPAYAAELGFEPVETVVWSCDGCGSQTMVLDPIEVDVLEATHAA